MYNFFPLQVLSACGNDNDTSVIETTSATSRDRCLEQCKADDNCEWFTFDALAGNCTQYLSCGNVTQCEACISGQKECDFSQVGYDCSVGGVKQIGINCRA